MRRPHRRTALIGAAVAVAVLAGGVVVGQRLGEHRTPAAPSDSTPTTQESAPTTQSAAANPSAPWAADFAALQAKLGGQVEVALAAIGAAQDPVLLGSSQDGPAWSTIKVPLVIAALRHQDTTPAAISAAMTAAITESDNASAESIWAGLGDPVTAARQIHDVLLSYGDQTTEVQSKKIRPEYTAFGQTQWSLNNQLRFLSGAYCDPANTAVFDLMGKIEDAQKWGLGTLPGIQFKGGWGPDPAGHYLVRQIGVITTPAGATAVAVATTPTSGTLDDGTQTLTTVAHWLDEHHADLPAGRCPTAQ